MSVYLNTKVIIRQLKSFILESIIRPFRLHYKREFAIFTKILVATSGKKRKHLVYEIKVYNTLLLFFKQANKVRGCLKSKEKKE